MTRYGGGSFTGTSQASFVMNAQKHREQRRIGEKF